MCSECEMQRMKMYLNNYIDNFYRQQNEAEAQNVDEWNYVEESRSESEALHATWLQEASSSGAGSNSLACRSGEALQRTVMTLQRNTFLENSSGQSREFSASECAISFSKRTRRLADSSREKENILYEKHRKDICRKRSAKDSKKKRRGKYTAKRYTLDDPEGTLPVKSLYSTEDNKTGCQLEH